MAGNVKRRTRLTRIGACGLVRIVHAARRIHGAGTQQHIVVAEPIFDRGNHFGAAPLRTDIVARAHEHTWQQPAPGEFAIIAWTFTQPRRMDGPGLAAQYDPVDTCELGQCRQADGVNLSALGLEDAGNILQGGSNLGMCRKIVLMEMPNEPDPDVPDTAIKHVAKVSHLRRCASRVRWIMPGDGIQQQCIVGDRACQRTDMVEGKR